MPDFDLRSPTVHVFCCASCSEPVTGTASGTKLELRCGYCGKDDVREIAAPKGVTVDRIYRGRAPGEPRTVRGLDFAIPPRGLERFARLRKNDRDAIAKAWREALAEERTVDDHDRRVVFLGASLAAIHEQLHHDALRARATLETTFDHAHHPALRALVATRLAMLAARSGATELAERWLEELPDDLYVAEVSGARRVARAMICHKRDDTDGVLEHIGQGNTAEEIVPPYRWVAVALRMDAHERRGEHKQAYGVWNALSRTGGAQPALAAARINGLAPITRKRIQTLGFAAIAVIVLLLAALASAIASIATGSMISMWVLLAAFAAFGVLMLLRWRMLP